MKTSLAKKIFAIGSSAAMLLAAVPFVASAAVHSAGSDVLSNGTVYFINGSGQKQPYTSAGAFLSYGFNSWSNVVPASPEDLALPTGAFVPPMDGSLINDNGTVYLITNGQRAGFTSAANFLGLGYAWSNVIPGDTSFMTSAALVNSSAMVHPAGTLVNDNGTVYLMTNSGKQGIPSLSVFNSWGYSFSKVVLANSYDHAVAMSNGVMPAMVLGCLSPLNCSGSNPAPVSNGQLNVSLDSSSPASGSVAKGSKVTFSRFNFSAGSNGATISSLVVTRIGLSSDSDVQNVYLFNTASGNQLAVGSINSGRVTFNLGSNAVSVPANGSVVLGVRADMSTTAQGGTTGDSIGYGLASSADAAGSSGSFPVNGSLQTIAAVSNLGALNITSTANVATSVNAGTLSANVGYFQFVGSQQPLSISSIKFTEIGSIANNNLANFKLINGATQVGSTIPSMAADNTITFNLAGSPLIMPSGQTANIWLVADITGGPNRNFQFTIQRTSDVTATDTTYNTGIVPTLASGTSPVPSGTTNQVTVAQGTATISVDSSSPTGNVAVAALGAPLALFDVTSAGEDVRISQIITSLNSTAGGTLTNPDFFKNGKLIVDPTITNGVVTGGSQIGSTVNLNFGTISFATAAQQTTFSIPGYWVIPAGTTHKVAVVADMVAGTTTAANLNNANMTAELVGSGITAQGATSLQTITFGTSVARTLTLAAGALTGAVNTAFVVPTSTAPSGVPGQASVRIASFTLTAGSSESVNLTQLSLATSAVFAANFQNLKLNVSGTQVGNTVGAPASSSTYTFTPSSALSIPAGGAVVVDIYADILSGATTASNLATVNLSAVTATGAIDNSSLTISSQTGQTAYVATSGALTVSLDSQNPTAASIQQLPMGSPQQTLAVFNFAASAAENINITKVVVTDVEAATNNGIGDLQNMKLYVNGVAVCSGLSVPSLTAATSTTATATFNLQSCPIVVPANSNVSVFVKSDISAYPNGVSAATHQLRLAASAVTSLGSVSGASGGASALTNANSGTVYKTALTIAQDPSSPSGLKSASATQTVAVWNVSNAANAANQQATLWPVVGSGNSISFGISSTLPIPASTSRVFAVFKNTDLVNPVLKVTIATGTSPAGTWNGTLTINDLASPTATFTPTGANSLGTGPTVTANTVTPVVVNSGVTQQFIVQFDTSDASTGKTFTFSIPTQGSNQVWSDGISNVSTLNSAPLTFGTSQY